MVAGLGVLNPVPLLAHFLLPVLPRYKRMRSPRHSLPPWSCLPSCLPFMVDCKPSNCEPNKSSSFQSLLLRYLVTATRKVINMLIIAIFNVRAGRGALQRHSLACLEGQNGRTAQEGPVTPEYRPAQQSQSAMERQEEGR